MMSLSLFKSTVNECSPFVFSDLATFVNLYLSLRCVLMMFVVVSLGVLSAVPTETRAKSFRIIAQQQQQQQ